MTMMTPHSEGIQQIMKILGLPANVVSFHLHADLDHLPVVNVTYYPEDSVFGTTVETMFHLVPKE